MTAAADSAVLLGLLVLLPAGVGAVLLLARRAERVATVASLLTAAAMVVLAIAVAVRRPGIIVPFVDGADLRLEVDALAALMLVTLAVVTLLVLAFSAADIHRARPRFHGLMLVFVSAAAMTATAASLPALLIAWEVMGATSYALIGFWWREQDRVSAGLTAFLTTRTADLGLYAAAAAALAGGAGLALTDLPQASTGWRQVVVAGVLVAALGKAAQLPFSFWLSRAMQGPSPVSALLHSAAMVAMGGYLLLRVEPLLASTSWALTVTAWVGALTAVLLGVVAMAQRDLKQLLAASTAAQLGFVVMAAGVSAVTAGAAHLVAHASTKALLFLAAGAWLAALGTKSLPGLAGVARRWPVAGWSATIGLLSLAGVAPLSLWSTKDAVLASALEVSPWLYATGMAASLLSAGYAGKVLVTIVRRVPPDHPGVTRHLDEEQQGSRHLGWREQGPLVVLAAGAAVLGLLALPPLAAALARSLGAASPHATFLELGASAVLAIIVVVLVGRWGVPEPGWARRWLGLEAFAHALAVRPTLVVAHGLARFDDLVLDRAVMRVGEFVVRVGTRSTRLVDRAIAGAVDGLATATDRAAQAGASADDRRVDGVVNGIASRVKVAGALARRPQTGQLHQYYLQAAAVLAVGTLLLVVMR